MVHVDKATSWGDQLRFEIERTDHQKAHGLYRACTNMAEGYFCRLRRAEIGIHHVAGSHLLRYAQKSSWRESNPFLSGMKEMIGRKPTYFRNALNLSDKVQVKVLRRRLKLTDQQFASVVRKSGKSISAITKEAAKVI